MYVWTLASGFRVSDVALTSHPELLRAVNAGCSPTLEPTITQVNTSAGGVARQARSQLGSFADMPNPRRHVRFTPESGRRVCRQGRFAEHSVRSVVPRCTIRASARSYFPSARPVMVPRASGSVRSASPRTCRSPSSPSRLLSASRSWLCLLVRKAIAIAVRNVSGRKRWSKLNEWRRVTSGLYRLQNDGKSSRTSCSQERPKGIL
jgi:hypothetical protein